MADIRECRVCGKKYEYCKTESWGAFRWRDVACSIECAVKYLNMADEKGVDLGIPKPEIKADDNK